MDLESTFLESNSENLNDSNDVSSVNNGKSNENQINCEKEYTTWSEFVEAISEADQIKSEHIDRPYECSEIKNFPVSSGSSENITDASAVNPESRKGRASVVRLQAVAQPTGLTTVNSDADGAQVQKINSAVLANDDSSRISAVRMEAASNLSEETLPSLLETQFLSSTETPQGPGLVLASYPSRREMDLEPSPVIQRFVTSEGQYVYSYRDGVFYSSLQERENHNEKERQRRRRVSTACGKLRQLVPGLAEKTDKASVFEQTAQYMQFLRKKYGTQYDQVWMALLLSVSSRMAFGDLYHHMEDAFAEGATHRACRRGDKFLFCRLGNLQQSSLDHLDPCLCTHLIYEIENKASASQKHPAMRSLLTMPLALLMTGKHQVTSLVDSVRTDGFDGVDITIGDEEARRTESLSVLQDLGQLLAGMRPSEKLLSLTFPQHVPEPSFVSQIFSTTEVAMFTLFPDFNGTRIQDRQFLEDFSRLPIPGDRILYGIALGPIPGRVSTGQVPFLQKCADISTQNGADVEATNSRGQNSGNLMERLRSEVQYAVENEMAGIHVWSLAVDDADGTCGTGYFPVLHSVRNKLLNQLPKPFGEFADLDIVLSPGESQAELQFVQDLDATPEEIKKLPCGRVGFFRHPSDCTKFYHCSEYRATKFNHSGPYAGFLYKCPTGLVYDERQESCIWPSWSDPCQGSGELLPVPARKFTCVTPGFHVDPENCRWFYYCSDLGDGRLEAFEFLCPSNLLGFDEEKLLCNWKWTVPVCVGYFKKPETGIGNVSTTTSQQRRHQTRQPKVLKIQGIFELSNLTSVPHSGLKASIGEYFSSRTESLVPQRFATTDMPRITPSGLQPIEQNSSAPSARFVNDKQTPAGKKYGTAVWRRSWISGRTTDPRSVASQLNAPGYNSSDEKANYRTPIVENGRISNQNELEMNVERRLVIPFENDAEPKKSFVGQVRKITFGRQANQTTGLWRNKDENGGQNPDTIARGIVLDNAPIRVSNGNTKKLEMENPQNAPFVNVRCSKLEREDDGDVSTLGCTSEVSLAIKVGRGKDRSKYILRADQISRTAYQETQGSASVEIPGERSNEGNTRAISKLAQRIGSSSWLIYPDKESIEIDKPLHVTSSNPKSVTESSVTTISKNRPGFDWEVFPQTESIEEAKIARLSNHNESSSVPFKPKSQQLNGKNERRTGKQISEDGVGSMPIHFYPQGVLLNIDLAHVNEIPPQILLEVDNMLRNYMERGDIDLNLLEKKLNASTENMEMEEYKSSEPGEIMEMIKVIEYIINTTRERETVEQPAGDDAINVTDSSLESEYVNITVSDTAVTFGHARIGQSPDNTELTIQSINDKIQNPGTDATVLQNSSDSEPFGRRRLIRKFRYPSIREQLEKQTRHQNSQENVAITRTSDSDYKTDVPTIYRYPLSRNNALLDSHRALGPEARDQEKVLVENVLRYPTANPPEEYNAVRPASALRDPTLQWEERQQSAFARSSGLTSSHGITRADTEYPGRFQNTTETFETTNKTLESYRHSSVNRATLQNDVQSFPTLKYGDRTYINQRTFKQETYSRSSANAAPSRNFPTSGAVNFRGTNVGDHSFPENNPDFNNYFANGNDEINKARIIDVPSDAHPVNAFDKTRVGVPILRNNSARESLDNRLLHLNVPENGAFLSEDDSNFDTNTVHGKRKKVRILVRKVADSESVQLRGSLSKNNFKKNIEQRISKSVIRALKNRLNAEEGAGNVELQIQYQDNVWNVPFVDNKSEGDLTPAVCTRPGLFQHPRDCNMFYECFWDKWLQRFTLHVFSCPVRLVYDDSVRGCGRPSADSTCASFAR